VRAFEGRPCGCRGRQHAVPVAQYNFAVGADVEQQLEFFRPVETRREYARRNIRADKGGDSGQHHDSRVAQEGESAVACTIITQLQKHRLERHPRHAGRIFARKEVHHDGVSGDRNACNLAFLPAGCGKLILDKTLDLDDDRLLHRLQGRPVIDDRLHPRHHIRTPTLLHVGFGPDGKDFSRCRVQKAHRKGGSSDVDGDAERHSACRRRFPHGPVELDRYFFDGTDHSVIVKFDFERSCPEKSGKAGEANPVFQRCFAEGREFTVIRRRQQAVRSRKGHQHAALAADTPSGAGSAYVQVVCPYRFEEIVSGIAADFCFHEITVSSVMPGVCKNTAFYMKLLSATSVLILDARCIYPQTIQK